MTITANQARGHLLATMAGQVGATLVATPEQLEQLAAAMRDAYAMDDQTVVEHWIDGHREG